MTVVQICGSFMVALIFGQSLIYGQPQFQNPSHQFFPNPNPSLTFGKFDPGPLYDFGPEFKDVKLVDREAQTGRQVDLYTWFPYYGSRYNYTIISIHGYLAFANVLEDGLNFRVDDVSDWPQDPDPAMIAVYTCRQKLSEKANANQKGVYYRLIVRQDMALNNQFNQQGMFNKPSRNNEMFIDSSPGAEELLNRMQKDLADGMVGAKSFRPDIALIVTWQNMSYFQASASESEQTATYQAVFMTDRAGQLSYVILNYHSLGFAGGDIRGGAKHGRCEALLNGGNQTGSVLVDPVWSKFPNKLFQMSSVPHRVGGRYLFRVDDIVRRGGCSNLTAGTYRLTIYPDIVNMLGETTVQVNGPCYQVGGNPPTLNIGENYPAQCIIKNPAIAECKMRQFYQWGAKDVFLKYEENKAYIGSIYYVPVGLDPFGLSVDEIVELFKNPPTHSNIKIRWYPGNFTRADGNLITPLYLSVYGYREIKDPVAQKYVNTFTKLAVLKQIQNTIPPSAYGITFTPQQWDILSFPINPVSYEVNQNDILSYSFGILKLETGTPTGPSVMTEQGKAIWSPPIPLHWMWLGVAGLQSAHKDEQRRYVTDVASKACISWFEDDGKQWNFIQDTESNASCPCLLDQALSDFGRFMPHPKCSQKLRNVICDVYTGARECFLSAENIISKFATHYGQVCCYDEKGYLMQTTYASVQPQVESDHERVNRPYNPGFPQRAYELGTPSFYKQYEAPTLSNYFHDLMPYYQCCQWSPNHCQFFYWRRPSSGCQEYRPPGIASVVGAGHFTTFDGVQYTFEGDGSFVYLYKTRDEKGPDVMIQIRMERYPNRFVDFSHRNTLQQDLVQPVNGSVVTGVAIQEGTSNDNDRVVILCRKDTRRFKYRTNVIVNDEIRYFDTMKMQKFRGVTIYINDVREGQSEIYVTLLNSRIGLRIRESYAQQIQQQQVFEESMGLLDVKLSIPSEYFVTTEAASQTSWEGQVMGLVGTYSNNTQDEFMDSDNLRPMGGYSSDSSAAVWAKGQWAVDGSKFQNLFILKDSSHKDWPEAKLLNPIYKVAPDLLSTFTFNPRYDQDFYLWVNNTCKIYPSVDGCPPRSVVEDLDHTCLANKWCIYDYITLQQKLLAENVYKEKDVDKGDRLKIYAATNSCAAINIQYPEYLYIEPARGGYLGGDMVQFHCYQNGWLKGDAHYQCKDGQWNKGSQPWCRERELENTLWYLSIIFGLFLSITLIACIFLCCFCYGKRRRSKTPMGSRRQSMTKIPVIESVSTDESKKMLSPPDLPPPGRNGIGTLRPEQPPIYNGNGRRVEIVGTKNSSPSSLTFTSV